MSYDSSNSSGVRNLSTSEIEEVSGGFLAAIRGAFFVACVVGSTIGAVVDAVEATGLADRVPNTPYPL